ncbi:PREDICTED: calcium-binding tyrosine phosphorylation-regulated protein isoform X2 [Calidris pugnax]|uniref:calcium-binding tyrosine phosphorylation-regulated protein isoform X2 n=1 Tax=Calidris pugnax TaxID=198806 RepID=UPI00071CBC95|nr:PREDICTED: calcium-binding tyrosine phosphorylation-regulated protein isoform X2 [Calidris pugnax]
MQSSKITLVPRGLKILLEGVSQAVMENNPNDITEFFALYFQELISFRKGHPDLDIRELVHKFEFVSENASEGLEEKTTEHTDTLFSEEHKRKDKCTDTEEDQLLKEPEIQYSSKVTQHPSNASFIAESNFPPGSARSASPEGPELVYVPAEATQLAAHVLGNTGSFYSVRDVATSVQTLQEDSQTSENELAPGEGAAEDASAVPAAEASVEAVRSQPGAWSQSSIAGELGPSDSQADVSTNDLDQGSMVTLWKEPAPSGPPSPALKDPLQAVPFCNEAEATSAIKAVKLQWDGQTACLLKTKQPLAAGQGSSATAIGLHADASVCHPERAGSPAQVESTEQVYVWSATTSGEAGQPPPLSNVWTLYCLTDLRQGQKSQPSLPAGAGVSYCQGTPRLSRGGSQQCGQLSQVSAPVYVLQEDSKRENAPPFILVGSNILNAQDWEPTPGQAVFEQQGAGARRRYVTVPVPVARPAAEETDMAGPSPNPAEETRAEPCLPDVCLVAIPLDDVMSAKTRLTSC